MSISSVIVPIIVVFVTVCVIRRRNERHHHSSGRKPGTGQRSDEAHPGSSVDAKRDPLVETNTSMGVVVDHGTSKKTACSLESYYANVNEPDEAGEESKIGIRLKSTNEVRLAPPIQVFTTAQISKDAEPCSRNKLPVIQTSSNSSNQYECMDFLGGTETCDRKADPRITYQDLLRESGDVFSQYQPLHVPKETRWADPFVSGQQRVSQQSSNSCNQYESMGLPLVSGEAEHVDTHLCGACDEKPPSEKKEMEDSSKGSIDASGIHVYANIDKRLWYGRRNKIGKKLK